MKLRKNKKALAAVAVVAFATHPGRALAEDITVEIHELKEAVKQLEAEVAKEKHERKEAQGPVRNAAAQPGPGPGARTSALV
jgi:Sec-independent protein translocase protein TatA